MKLIPVYILALLAGLSFHNAIAAPAVKHNHNGRVHSHALPASGVKHYHKHVHKGRAHIHPYSAKVGFKHTHNRSSRSKAWANAVKHQHAGRSRPHNHPLPKSGIKHNHQHKHGGRSHIHPLPMSGVKHFHRLNSKSVTSKTPPKAQIIRDLSIKQQMEAVLKSSKDDVTKAGIKQNRLLVSNNSSNTKPQNKTTTPRSTASQRPPIISGSTFKKVLAYGLHQHNGRTHQHNLPKAGKNHTHKGIVSKNIITKKAVIKNKVARTPPRKRVIKKKVNRPTQKTKIAAKPYKAKSKQTPAQIASSNRQFTLALRYENGTGVKKNLTQAINWYLRSAKQGNPKAQFNLASLYENGEGSARNIPQAIRWYTTAAHNGDVNAQVNLGNQYARGINVPKNIKEAAKWYKRAADQGDMRGRANLNYLIEGNNGVIKR